MSFRTLSMAAGLLFGVLCLTLIFLPQVVYWLFQLQGNDLGDFLAKRAAALFFGLTILCLYARNSVSIEAQHLVLLTVGAAMGAMALFGVYEFIRGAAGSGILMAIGIEITIAVTFLHRWFKTRTAA